MNGSKPQIILPGHNIQPSKPLEETPTITHEEEVYLPDSTRILLNQCLKELSFYVQQEHIPDIANTLSHVFNKIDCVKVKHKGESKKRNSFIIQEYLNAMIVEGKSENTIAYYRNTISMLCQYYPDVHLQDMNTQQLRDYFYNRITYDPQEDPVYKNKEQPVKLKKWSKRTADNNRRILNTFFQWMVGERLIIFNPLQQIKKIKYDQVIKQPFTSEHTGRYDIRKIVNYSVKTFMSTDTLEEAIRIRNILESNNWST